jgi:hypothetical protein
MTDEDDGTRGSRENHKVNRLTEPGMRCRMRSVSITERAIPRRNPRHHLPVTPSTYSAGSAHCLSVTSRRGHSLWRWPANRGVTAAAPAKLMLTPLSLPGGTAPRGRAHDNPVAAIHGRRRYRRRPGSPHTPATSAPPGGFAIRRRDGSAPARSAASPPAACRAAGCRATVPSPRSQRTAERFARLPQWQRVTVLPCGVLPCGLPAGIRR